MFFFFCSKGQTGDGSSLSLSLSPPKELFIFFSHETHPQCNTDVYPLDPVVSSYRTSPTFFFFLSIFRSGIGKKRNTVTKKFLCKSRNMLFFSLLSFLFLLECAKRVGFFSILVIEKHRVHTGEYFFSR